MTLYHENNNSFTGIAAGDTTDTLEINTEGCATDVGAFVDNNSGGAPADFTLIAERYSTDEERWMEFGRTSITGASQPQSFTDPAIPDKMRYSIQNDSGGSADYRLNLVSHGT